MEHLLLKRELTAKEALKVRNGLTLKNEANLKEQFNNENFRLMTLANGTSYDAGVLGLDQKLKDFEIKKVSLRIQILQASLNEINYLKSRIDKK